MVGLIIFYNGIITTNNNNNMCVYMYVRVGPMSACRPMYLGTYMQWRAEVVAGGSTAPRASSRGHPTTDFSEKMYR